MHMTFHNAYDIPKCIRHFIMHMTFHNAYALLNVLVVRERASLQKSDNNR